MVLGGLGSLIGGCVEIDSIVLWNVIFFRSLKWCMLVRVREGGNIYIVEL